MNIHQNLEVEIFDDYKTSILRIRESKKNASRMVNETCFIFSVVVKNEYLLVVY